MENGEMSRTQIYLTAEEVAALERASKQSGRSKSQLIREAIDRAYLGAGPADLLLALERSRGTWSSRGDGASFVEQRRRGRLAGLHEAPSTRRARAPRR